MLKTDYQKWTPLLTNSNSNSHNLLLKLIKKQLSNTIYKSRSFSPGVDTLAKMPPSNADTCSIKCLKFRTVQL